MRNSLVSSALVSGAALSACSGAPGGIDCDSTEMRSATYQYVEGLQQACGGATASAGLGDACAEDMRSGMKDIWSEEQLACIDHNIERIKSRELPAP